MKWVFLIVLVSMLGPLLRSLFHDGEWNGRKRRVRGRGSSAEAERLEAALAERDTVIEDLQRRLSELESRLDFTERRLVERNEQTIAESR
jgi:hypothetical protein